MITVSRTQLFSCVTACSNPLHGEEKEGRAQNTTVWSTQVAYSEAREFVQRPFKRTAYNAEEEEQEEREESEPEDEEPEGEDELYACVTCLNDDDYENVEDQIEQDVVTCFVCVGADLADEEVCEQISACVHDELFGFYSREEGKRNTVIV